MKTASPELQEFLVSAQGFAMANLYTITLSDGTTVLRWTNADVPVVRGTTVWMPYPSIRDTGVKTRCGLSVDSVSITLNADDRHTIGGVPVITFAKQNGLDGASILCERSFAPSWSDEIVGTVIRFTGRFSELRDAGRTQVEIVVSSPTELLNADIPVEEFQPSCLNTLFDSRCALNRADFKSTGTIDGTSTQTLVSTSLSAAAGTFDLGTIVFTSGSCAGQRRSIRSQDSSGNLQLVLPLPAAPIAGDTFDAYPGCDLSLERCDVFGNRIHFRGYPFVPLPETAV